MPIINLVCWHCGKSKSAEVSLHGTPPMNIQKFIYRAPHLVEPLSRCLEHLKEENKKLSDEISKYRQVHSDNPYDFSEIDRNRAQNLVLKQKNMVNQIKRFELWLYECQNRSWFTKYVLDENDLSELYQYKFTQLI